LPRSAEAEAKIRRDWEQVHSFLRARFFSTRLGGLGKEKNTSTTFFILPGRAGERKKQSNHFSFNIQTISSN